jgi:hypothetical protein
LQYDIEPHLDESEHDVFGNADIATLKIEQFLEKWLET